LQTKILFESHLYFHIVGISLSSHYINIRHCRCLLERPLWVLDVNCKRSYILIIRHLYKGYMNA